MTSALKKLQFSWKKLNLFLYFYSTLLYIIFTVSMVLQSRQNMKKSMYVSEQNFIPEYIFILSSTQIFLAYPFCQVSK
jgi:hypothetical protein